MIIHFPTYCFFFLPNEFKNNELVLFYDLNVLNFLKLLNYYSYQLINSKTEKCGISKFGTFYNRF